MSRIAFVLWNGAFGGAESLNLELARRARELGHDVSMVILKEPLPLIERAREHSVPTLELDYERGSYTVLHPRRYAARIASLRPDLVVAMSVNRLAWGLRLGGYRGPLIAVEHGELLRHRATSPAERLLRTADRALGSLLTTEVTVSPFMLSQLPRGTRARVIPNGVDIQRFRPGDARANGELVFGFAGRLVEGKGVEQLIDAHARLSRLSTTELRIAGDGPLRGSLQARAAASPGGDRVAFLGAVREMPRFWQGVDVAVSPSAAFVESFNMSALEAMACGRPVIATRNGGLGDLVLDGVTGTLVDPGDVLGLERAMLEYLPCEPRWARGRAARALVEREYSIDRCLERYLVAGGLSSASGRGDPSAQSDGLAAGVCGSSE